ncbi:helix-turn-helix domain-containing protein [Neobacillus muris]|uniref:helix-turn-helix domain-containing protein n=1 Tax=Neobacillus muris TaxID=2941334 RepID=UPI00203C2E2B|nr:helix-turn-helix transcriptional regulator [Neobacillus muris]
MENNFGNLVERERKARGWSYDRLASETEKFGDGLSASYIFRLVKGKQNGSKKYDPTTKTVKILMDTLNLEITDVLKSLGMEQSLKHLYDERFNQPTDLKELLVQANIIIKTDSGVLQPSKRQKKLIGDLVDDFCKVAQDDGSFENFSMKAVGYAENLRFLISQEKYVIELEDAEIQLEVNIEVMVEKYGIKKEDVLEDLQQVDLKALYHADSSIPLFLLNEDWICEREGNTIVVRDKISELRNAYRKK